MNKKVVSLILLGALSLSVSPTVFANETLENTHSCQDCNVIGDNKIVGNKVIVDTNLNGLENGETLIQGKEYKITFIHEARGSFTGILKHFSGFKEEPEVEELIIDGVKHYKVTATLDTSKETDNLDVVYQLYMQTGNNGKNGKKINYQTTELVNYHFKVKKPDSVFDNKNIFPKSDQSNLSFVGDPIPYYENGEFNIFYLDDIRDKYDIGFHPWSLLKTKDFYNYTNEGIAINYSNDNLAQDLALGTGSVIKDKDGVYHAFFTGFNDRKDWTQTGKEALMHATSTDLKNWTKHYEDTIYAPEQYSKIDFRDPNVFYNEDDGEYWMLITTRKSDSDTAVIAKYVSNDLKNWTDAGVFFSNDMNNSNMECPTLIKYNDYWYLTFSDQSDSDPYGKRVVHYRKAKSLSDEFVKLNNDSFDGNGLYAGKLVKDYDNNKVYLAGWIPTKQDYKDTNDYNWAGNLIVHQIKQDIDGDIYAVPVETVENKIDQRINLVESRKDFTVEKNNNSYSFSGNDYESVTFDPIYGTNKITGKINTKDKNDKFGFMFNVGESGKSSLNIVFNKQFQRLEFYDTYTEGSFDRLMSTKSINIPDNGSLDFTILVNDSIAVLYVNDEVAFSTRMYNMQNNKWGIFANNSNVTVNDLRLAK